MSDIKQPLRVLVCGGRDYGAFSPSDSEDERKLKLEDRKHMLNIISDLNEEYDMTIIQGEAKGADILGKACAELLNIPVESFPADWDRYGKRAGFIRNSEMLTKGKPDLVIAFRGGKGTKMMCDIAERAGVKVNRTWSNE